MPHWKRWLTVLQELGKRGWLNIRTSRPAVDRDRFSEATVDESNRSPRGRAIVYDLRQHSTRSQEASVTVVHPEPVRSAQSGYPNMSGDGLPNFTSKSTDTADLQRIWEWNHTVPPIIDRCVHDMIHERVIVSPSAPAICAWNGNLTYAELAHDATGLARSLIDFGVCPGTFVPLLFEKSMWTIVAMLAIMKTGAAFVLLDASLPQDRLRGISRQTGANVIVSSKENESLGARMASRVVVVDSQTSKAFCDTKLDRELPLPDPSLPMYVAFTSGSTGTPKGAIITHRNLASALVHQRGSLKVTHESRVYDFCSYGFDVSICNIFATLEAGGCVCVPHEDDRRDRLAESIALLEANTIDLTPSVARLLSPEQVPGIRTIVFGGEALHIKDVEPWWGQVQIVSLYGPCECTPNSTIVCDPRTLQEVTTMGKGAGLVTWVVDPEDHNTLLPVGEPGELLLEGPLVCHGYLDSPVQTAASFIEDPHWLVRGTPSRSGRRGRLYKTGDIVRYNEDRTLSFVGRKDTQVKIRGQRIELGEIEHALRLDSYVDEAVAITHTDKRQETRIAGFVTVRDNGTTLDHRSNHGNEERHQEEWGRQFNDDYTCFDQMQAERVGRDFMGWTSMYDGSDIDKKEMNEWLDDTITSIRNGSPPGKILEIGTGSGMVLFNLIEGLQSYVGLEPSSRGVDFVKKIANARPELADKVQIIKGTAADLGQVKLITTPEIVIINSVAQYFPSQSYLLHVVEEILRIESVKTIFFGDIRSLPLHSEFLAARALHITGGAGSKDEIRRIMADLERAESELLISPALFTGLQTRLPNLIYHVEILPKMMRATNELSAFRYAAVIHIKREQHPSQPIVEIKEDQWIDFTEQGRNVETLSHLLQQNYVSDIVAVSNIPHSKSIFERAVVYSLDNKDEEGADPNTWLATARQIAGNTPSLAATDLNEIAARSGFQVQIGWARQGPSHGIDAIFHRKAPSTNHGTGEKRRRLFRFPYLHLDQALYELCSAPLRSRAQQQTRDRLHRMLCLNLSSYMVPQTLIILDAWPLTKNGKIDRKALAERASAHQLDQNRFWKDEPNIEFMPEVESNVESQIRAIWGRVLDIDPGRIGSNDTFFELGGSSMDIIKVVQLAKKEGLMIKAVSIIKFPRLCDMARCVKM